MYNEKTTSEKPVDILKGIALILTLVLALFISVKVFSQDNSAVKSRNHTYQERPGTVYDTPVDSDEWNSAETKLHPIPVYVTPLKVRTNSTYNTFWDTTSMEDSYGDLHSGEIVRMVPHDDYVSTIEFINGMKYSRFTVTVFTSLKKESHQLRLKIYADDIQVYDSGLVNRLFKGDDITLDITGVYALKIECIEDGYVSDFDTSPAFCLQDMRFWT